MLKNITLSAEERAILRARERAMKEKTTLNAVFRVWLIQYGQGETPSLQYETVMKRLKHIKSGKHYSRDELNER
ncbi:MAG TPA: hypothetical protein VJL60_01835 [Gammaproteobacteria bacterium]|nr:hypothetical protein [Gammaproteobacteria bacterium]